MMTQHLKPILAIVAILVLGAGFWLWFHLTSAQIESPAALATHTPVLSTPRAQQATVVLPLLPSPTASAAPLPSFTPTPPYTEKFVIGYSVEKRPLEVYRFGRGGDPEMIVAGIHGGYEWNTVALADQLIEALQKDPTLVPDDKTLYILRVLNPDGYEKDKGPDGRANANDVDINRNWDANWQANWSGAHCWSYRFLKAGTGPMSEPETQALARFFEDHKIEALISYHSAGLGIFSGGWPKDANSIKLANAVAQVSPYPFPPVATDCEYTGQLIDWASLQGAVALDIELTDHIDTDLAANLRILKAFLAWEP